MGKIRDVHSVFVVHHFTEHVLTRTLTARVYTGFTIDGSGIQS